MIRVKKGSVLAIFALLIILGLAAGGYYLYQRIEGAWNDISTWTTESKLILPSTAKDLDVSLAGSPIDGNFTFTAKYCLLYAIEVNDNKATLTCSLLPHYYTVRQDEVPKVWTEASDIKLIVSKDDPAPDAFLGRLDLSFDSVSTLGSSVIPVSLEIVGKAEKPEATLANKLVHAKLVFNKQKQEVPVALTKWSVQRLDKATEERQTTYAKNWRKAVTSELNNYLALTDEKMSSNTKYFNSVRDVFKFQRVKCTDLKSCALQYEKNPAENFLYYVYGLEKTDKKSFDKVVAMMQTGLYPFTSTRKEATGSPECADCSPDWTELSAYTFPICPVNDVMHGTQSRDSALFSAYIKEFLSKSLSIPTSETTAIQNIDSQYKLADFKGTNSYESELIDALDMGCYYLLKNGVSGHTALQNKVITTYFTMLSESLGIKVSPTKASINEAIYSSTVYSPYKSTMVGDFSVMRFREANIEDAKTAAAAYTDWHSLLHTVILMYLYDGQN